MVLFDAAFGHLKGEGAQAAVRSSVAVESKATSASAWQMLSLCALQAFDQLHQPETYLDRDLIVRNFPVRDMSSRLDHFIPIHLLDRERRLGDRIAYSLIGPLG